MDGPEEKTRFPTGIPGGTVSLLNEKKMGIPGKRSMKEQSSISVVLAAYKGEKFIGEQLRSLFRQTRLPDEILIGDDSPDDATEKAVREVLPEAPASIHIHYRKNPLRLDSTQNFATLLGQASGDLIFICDQDDVWLEEKIARLATELETHPDCELVFCNSTVVDSSLAPLNYTTADVVHFTPEIAEKINAGTGVYDILRTPMIFGHNIAMRSTFRRLILPVPDLHAYDLWITLIGAGYGHVRCVFDCLTLFRRHGNNQSTQSRPPSLAERFQRLQQDRKKAFAEIWESEAHISAAVRRLRQIGPEEIPATRMKAAELSARYYSARLALQKLPRPLRPFRIPFIPGYFRCGGGVKSILRDLLI